MIKNLQKSIVGWIEDKVCPPDADPSAKAKGLRDFITTLIHWTRNDINVQKAIQEQGDRLSYLEFSKRLDFAGQTQHHNHGWRSNAYQLTADDSVPSMKDKFEVPEWSDLRHRFERIGLTFMAYVLIRNLLPLDHIFEHWFGANFPANCYLPGRLVLNVTASKALSSMTCSVHIIWCLWQRGKRPQYQPMFLFLLQDEEQIERHEKLLEVNYGVNEYGPSGVTLDKSTLLLRSIMCYPFRYGHSRIIYKIRPNRSKVAYKRLHRSVTLGYAYCKIVLRFFYVGFSLVCSYEILSDRGYVSAYSQCSPHLDALYAEDKLDFFSFSLTGHKFLAILLDGVENFIIWYMTLNAVVWMASIGFILNSDILLYWTHSDEKIDRVLRLIKQRRSISRDDDYESNDENSQSNGYNASNRWCNRCRRLKSSWSKKNEEGTETFVKRNEKAFKAELAANMSVRLTYELEYLIEELRVEIGDFFNCLRRADELVSDIISHGLNIWLSSFTLLTYLYITEPKMIGSFLIIRFFQVLAILSYSYMNMVLWRINRKLLHAHLKLCSILANYKSTDKVKFLDAIDYYNERDAPAFTFYHRYPVVSGTYLSVISWTLSSLIVVESLFKPT